MDQEIKNIISLLVNVLILPGLGTIIHGEKRRGIIQIIPIVLFVIIILILPPIDYASMTVTFTFIAFLIGILVWIWALLDGVAFVQNKEFYVFKNLK